MKNEVRPINECMANIRSIANKLIFFKKNEKLSKKKNQE